MQNSEITVRRGRSEGPVKNFIPEFYARTQAGGDLGTGILYASTFLVLRVKREMVEQEALSLHKMVFLLCSRDELLFCRWFVKSTG